MCRLNIIVELNVVSIEAAGHVFLSSAVCRSWKTSSLVLMPACLVYPRYVRCSFKPQFITNLYETYTYSLLLSSIPFFLLYDLLKFKVCQSQTALSKVSKPCRHRVRDFLRTVAASDAVAAANSAAEEQAPGSDGVAAVPDDPFNASDLEVELSAGSAAGNVGELGLFEAGALTARRRRLCTTWIASYRSPAASAAAASRRASRSGAEDDGPGAPAAARPFELLLAYGVMLREGGRQQSAGGNVSQARFWALEAEGALSPRSAAEAAADGYAAALNSLVRRVYGVQSYKVRTIAPCAQLSYLRHTTDCKMCSKSAEGTAIRIEASNMP